LPKIACQRVKKDMVDFLEPTQLGFGSKGGAEAAVHALRTFLTNRKNEPTVFAKIDFSNAFNSVERQKILEEARARLPSIYPFCLPELFFKIGPTPRGF